MSSQISRRTLGQRGTQFWDESRIVKEWRLRQHANHEILGSRAFESGALTPTWRNVLRLNDVAWLRDHQVGNDIVFPCSAYVAMAGEAVRQISGLHNYVLRKVFIRNAVICRDIEPIELFTSLRPVRLTDELMMRGGHLPSAHGTAIVGCNIALGRLKERLVTVDLSTISRGLHGMCRPFVVP